MTGKRNIFIVASILTLLLLRGAWAQQPTDGFIYFVDEGPDWWGNPDPGRVIRIRPDGSGRQVLIESNDGETSYHFPSPSFDGQRVVFARYPTRWGWHDPDPDARLGNLVIMDWDGSNVVEDLPGANTDVDERTPSFAPGDQAIYFARDTGIGNDEHEIFSYDLASEAVDQLTNLAQGITEDPAPSPDGSVIAFQSWGATQLFTMAPPYGNGNFNNTTNITEVMNPGCPPTCPQLEEDASISPDSAWLAFASTRNGTKNVFIAPLSNLTNATQITFFDYGSAEDPWWSPDGNWLSFYVTGRGGPDDCIWIVNVNDPENTRQPLPNTANGTFPRWGAEAGLTPTPTPTPTMTSTQTPTQTPGLTRIMPLGNSITQSNTSYNSYRRPLWQLLQDVNYNGDFVGSLTDNFGGPPPNPDFDLDHEGHWGWRADEILVNINAWATAAQPEVVLIHLGHNDLWQGQSVASTINELGQIIDEIRLVNATATFLLAQVIPATGGIGLDLIPDLNAQIPALAASKHTPSSAVIVIDQYTGFDPDVDTWDGVHPDASGEQKMAQRWFDAIQSLGFPLRINFQPPGSASPEGYRVDDGSGYAGQDGYSYGWL